MDDTALPVKTRALTIDTTKGHSLTANVYEPNVGMLGDVVIAPAMAVKQSFYAAFACYLAEQGYRVWTFDYHGIGASWQGPKRACTADITSWVENDFAAVLNHATSDHATSGTDHLPLFVVGHSLGGLVAPLLRSADRISGIVNISVGSGAKQYLTPRLQRSSPFLWHVLAPACCAIFGYFPGSRIGVMGDIPRNALNQWKRWCLNPEYLLACEPDVKAAYASVNCPVLSLFFTDDELLQEAGARWLHDAYASAALDYRYINPGEVGLKKIGHFGFFKKREGRVLWPAVSDWLSEQRVDHKR